jgi:hypothetical protein
MLGPDGHVQLSGLCNQIGEGGLGAIIGSELTIGEIVNLQLSVPAEEQPISLRAVVRWRERLQHGFEFFGAFSQECERVREYCQALPEQSRV